MNRQAWLTPRIPLLVATFAVACLTLPLTVQMTASGLQGYAVPGTAAVLVWTLYALPLLYVILRMDYFEREPSGTLGLALFWGLFIATGLSAKANTALMGMWVAVGGEDFAQRWGPALTGPSTEELTKGVGAIVVILLATRAIRTPLDGLVIGAVVGLGFQVFENLIYTLHNFVAMGPWQSLTSMFFLRGIASGLWSHAVYSGICGYGIGYAFTRVQRPIWRRLAVAFGTFVLAWTLHFLWNSVLVTDQIGIAAIPLKGGMSLAFFGWLLREGQRRDSLVYLPYLSDAAVAEPALAHEGEIAAMATWRTRREARKAVKVVAGKPGRAAAAQLQRAQATAARALACGDEMDLETARVGIYRARRSLQELLPAEVAGLPVTEAIDDHVPPAYGRVAGAIALVLVVLGLMVPPLAVVGGAVAAIVWVQARSRAAKVSALVRTALMIALGFLLALVAVSLFVGDPEAQPATGQAAEVSAG